MATTYLDSLEDEELEDLYEIIQEGATEQSPTIDKLISGAPKTKEMTFYKYYKDGPHFKTGGGLREPGYLVVSAKKPPKKAGSVIAEFAIPGGKLKAIEFSNDVYFFGYGAHVLFFPEQGGVVPATIEDAFLPEKKTAFSAPMIKFNTGYIPSEDEIDALEAGTPIEEFFNKSHGKDGRFSSGKGGGGGGGGGNQNQDQWNQQNRNQDQRNQQNRNHNQNRPGNNGNNGPRPPGGGRPPFKEKTKLQKVAQVTRDVLAVVAVVTVAITIISFAQRQQERKQRSGDYKQDEIVREKKRQEAAHWLKEKGHAKGEMDKDPPKLLDGYEYDARGKVTRTPGSKRTGPDDERLKPLAPGEGAKRDADMARYFDDPSSMVD